MGSQCKFGCSKFKSINGHSRQCWECQNITRHDFRKVGRGVRECSAWGCYQTEVDGDTAEERSEKATTYLEGLHRRWFRG